MSPSSADSWTSRAYVVGEIVLSLVAFVGAGVVLYFATNSPAQTAAVSVISSVVVFWFSRRAAEQATNTVKETTNGQLAELRATVGQLGALKARDLPVQDAAPIAANIVRAP